MDISDRRCLATLVGASWPGGQRGTPNGLFWGTFEAHVGPVGTPESPDKEPQHLLLPDATAAAAAASVVGGAAEVAHCRGRCRCRPRGASGLAVLARLVGGAGPQRASGASRTATMVLSVVGHRGLRVKGGGAKAALGRCCRPRSSYSLCLRRDYVTAAGASSPCRLADRLHTVQQKVVKGIVVAVTRV